jgi:hypothetical protein
MEILFPTYNFSDIVFFTFRGTATIIWSEINNFSHFLGQSKDNSSGVGLGCWAISLFVFEWAFDLV